MGIKRQRKNRELTARQILHDLSTPLTNAVLDLEELQLTLDTLSGRCPQRAQLQKLTDSIHAELKKMILLMRSRSRDLHRRQQYLFSPILELHQVIKAFKKPYGVDCRLTHSHVQFPSLYGSRIAFSQIITHILNNAAESYSQCSTRRIIDIHVSLRMRCLMISIADHGCGMSQLQLLIWRLCRDSIISHLHSHKKLPSGLGLLDAARLMTEGFNGDMDIISRRGLGTCVVLLFPVATDADADKDEQSASNQPSIDQEVIVE